MPALRTFARAFGIAVVSVALTAGTALPAMAISRPLNASAISQAAAAVEQDAINEYNQAMVTTNAALGLINTASVVHAGETLTPQENDLLAADYSIFNRGRDLEISSDQLATDATALAAAAAANPSAAQLQSLASQLEALQAQDHQYASQGAALQGQWAFISGQVAAGGLLPA